MCFCGKNTVTTPYLNASHLHITTPMTDVVYAHIGINHHGNVMQPGFQTLQVTLKGDLYAISKARSVNRFLCCCIGLPKQPTSGHRGGSSGLL